MTDFQTEAGVMLALFAKVMQDGIQLGDVVFMTYYGVLFWRLGFWRYVNSR